MTFKNALSILRACDAYGGLISLLALVDMSNENFLLWFLTTLKTKPESRGESRYSKTEMTPPPE